MRSKYLPHEFKVVCVRECEPMTELADTPEIVAQYWRNNIPRSDWYDPAKEAFVVLVLNTRRRIIGHNLVALGSLDTCSVVPREVFRPAIVAAGSAIVLLHNHPSGNPEPSEADIKVTRDLIRAGQLLNIEITDHIIMGSDRHTSLRSLGYFNY
jgi:DNA repair protein RadC